MGGNRKRIRRRGRVMASTGEVGGVVIGAASASSSKKPPKRFEIKKWNAVSLWAWGQSVIQYHLQIPISLSLSLWTCIISNICCLFCLQISLLITVPSAGIISWISVSTFFLFVLTGLLSASLFLLILYIYSTLILDFFLYNMLCALLV